MTLFRNDQTVVPLPASLLVPMVKARRLRRFGTMRIFVSMS